MLSRELIEKIIELKENDYTVSEILEQFTEPEEKEQELFEGQFVILDMNNDDGIKPHSPIKTITSLVSFTSDIELNCRNRFSRNRITPLYDLPPTDPQYINALFSLFKDAQWCVGYGKGLLFSDKKPVWENVIFGWYGNFIQEIKCKLPPNTDWTKCIWERGHIQDSPLYEEDNK